MFLSMNKEMGLLYNRLLNQLKSVEAEADRILESYKKMSPKGSEEYSDELKVYLYVQNNLMEEISDAVGRVEYYLKESEESFLVYDHESQRYQLAGWKDKTLSCGYPIEILNQAWGTSENEFKWLTGRIEHSNSYGGYYFYNKDGDHVSLREGMKVRIRIE